MNKKLMLIVSVGVGFLLTACDVKHREATLLQKQVDSLVAIVEEKNEIEQTMQESGALLDSIDAHRNRLRNQLWEGTTAEDFTDRMEELKEYVKRSEAKIHDLETSLRAAKQSGVSYNDRIRNMKEELEKNTKEIAALQEQVNQYKGENETLIKTVNLQQAEIEDKLNQITTKQEEVAQLETRISTILAQSKLDAGDAYYARAEALELAANRTNFAPRKKKTTRQQALDMYRMAVLYGKDDAQAKVDELASKL